MTNPNVMTQAEREWEEENARLNELTAQSNLQRANESKSNVTMLPHKPRRRESSFAAVVADLEVGESASRTHYLNPDMTLAELARDIHEMKAMIRNNAQPAVVAARKRTGGQYRVESGETISQAGNVYLLVIVTRIA